MTAYRPATCALLMVTLLLAHPLPVSATANDGLPKISLHLRSVTTKNACSNGLPDCRDALTEGAVSTPGDVHRYFAQVICSKGNMSSLAAAQFGIQYDDGCPTGRDDHDRVDIISWTRCATLEFATPVPQWPSPGGGNLVTWDAVNACQTGESAVAGYFYLTCYNVPDVLDVVFRPADNRALLADCGSIETLLPAEALGSVAFSADALTSGCNPCDGPCPTPFPRPGCPPLSADVIPPAAVADLVVTNATATSITLQWTATGDDGRAGEASSYLLKRSFSPITAANFGAATSVPTLAPGPSGATESKTVTGLLPNTLYYFAIQVRDEVPNASALSNVVSQVTGAPPPDVTPPGTVNSLTVISVTMSSALVQWQAPGDDGFSNGPAAAYDFRYATAPITNANWAAASQVANEPVPASPGNQQQLSVSGLASGTTWYIAMKSADEVPNVSGLSNVVAASTPATPAQQNAAASLLLHLEPMGINSCATGEIFDCRNARTNGQLLPRTYQAYLLAGQYAQIAGIECGITYSGGAVNGADDQSGVDVHAWTLCADLEFASSSPAWPAPGSGNLMTWTTAHCQLPNTAVAGYLYVAAYSPDEMKLTVRPGSGKASVATCASAETELPPDALGSVRFSGEGLLAGINPCHRTNPTPIQPSTWSRIKVLASPAVRPITRN